MYSKVKNCRICGSTNLSKYIDLGEMPLANSLIPPDKKSQKELKFPLKVLFCNNCALSQLSIVVDPRFLFHGYVYRSSVSKTFQNHCLNLAMDLKKYFPNNENPLVLDIASNDGCLLREFKKTGYAVLGVEPAENLAELARQEGIPTLSLFWGNAAVKKVIKDFGKPDIVTATNVLAHVDNINGFVSGVKNVLSDDGILVVEVPTVANIISKNEFDTIYHEHLSYFLLKPMLRLFSNNGFEVFDAKTLEIHGGTIRVIAAKKGSSRKVNKIALQKVLDSEKKLQLYEFGNYLNLAKNVNTLKKNLTDLLNELKQKDKHIAGYGAAAKGNTLLNYFGIGKDFIDFIIDDTPEKQKFLAPGQYIPIYPLSYLEEKKPDYLLLLAWNFYEELIEKTPAHRSRGGKYIVPIPKLKVI